MALKTLKCPNCDANVELDDSRAYGFCSYCGAQIQIKEIIEVHQTVDGDVIRSFEKMLEDGDAYLKFGEYYKAELVFMDAIRDYPAKARGYERLIKTVTRDYTLFLEGNQERVFTLADKMIAVALPEEIEQYKELKTRLVRQFSEGIAQQKKAEMRLQIEKCDKIMKKKLIVTLVALVIALVLQDPSKGSFLLAFLGLVACVIIIEGVISILRYKVKKDKLLDALGEGD